MVRHFLYVFLSVLLIFGCNSGPKLLKPAHNSNCQTIIEGTFLSDGEWTGDFPAKDARRSAAVNQYFKKVLEEATRNWAKEIVKKGSKRTGSEIKEALDQFKSAFLSKK